MVAVLLSHAKRQFYPSENNRYSFYLYYENSRWNFTKENASWINLHRTDIYRNLPFGAPDIGWLWFTIHNTYSYSLKC